ncbi:DNA polymerase III subunit delta [Tianweitania populi]|uniref:DNA-directed DNA polymerase n=1 Tax=Tianweitania populi TaxID=1607949 RepID=A0A8J3GKJ1_9HYPH|nr:DNA polymerase III subunit delta [Tianweitania populi]GHD17415.1 DNA polymerase III subunit delta [Tianweitania populi]
MAQKKNHEVDSWLARPDRTARIILVYGPDRGLVAERARKFALSTGIALDDPFSVVRLDAGDIESDPGRLFDEVKTFSMFSSQRLIWIRNAGAQKAFADAIKDLAKCPPADALVLIEGGDLKKGAGVRGVVETAFSGMALPCYSDDPRAIDALIDEGLQPYGLRIGLPARSRLKALLGGDRLASRGEIEKLALYCHGKSEVEEDDVALLIGDVSATSADDALNAALKGDVFGFQQALLRFKSAGGNRTTLLLSALRQLQIVQTLRAEMQASNRPAGAVIGMARPPLYFDRKAAVERALTRFSLPQASSALQRVQAAVLESRRYPDLSDAIIERCLLGLTLHRP